MGTPMPSGAKKLIKEEKIKLERNPLEVFDDIVGRYALDGFESIDKDDMVRLKWFGVYVQKPKSEGLFMLRIKIPAGRLSSSQARAIGRMAKRHGKNLADITTRQTIQLHWLPADSMPEIMNTIYGELDLYQEFSCGDAPRNVTACPLAGLAADEFVDTSELARAVSDLYYHEKADFCNLPRKYKTALGGCRLHCHLPQINDIAFYGVERERDGQLQRGLGLAVGGGLSSTPHMAQSLRVFLEPKEDLIVDVARHVTRLYSSYDHLRQNRRRARIKFHIADVGWKAFRDELEASLGYELEHDESIGDPVGAVTHDHMGPGEQADGRMYLGVPVPRGRISGDQLVALADLAAANAADGEGRVQFTPKQNLIILDIDPAKMDALRAGVEELGFAIDAHPLVSTLITCTGAEFCNLAISETKSVSRHLLDELTETVTLDEPFFIAMTGCPNSCAHYWIGDIGLTGTKVKYQGKMCDAFLMLIGAKLGEDPRFGREVNRGEGAKNKVKIPAPLLHQSINQLLRTYQDERSDEDRFTDWAHRQPMERLADLATPAELAAGS